MSMNEKLLFLWLIVAVVFSLFFHHFWADAIEAIGKIIATNLVFLPGIAKFTAGMFGLFFLQ